MEGERRTPLMRYGRRKNINFKNIEVFSPVPTMTNHRKHEGLVYREAMGGEETKGKPRFHGDWFE